MFSYEVLVLFREFYNKYFGIWSIDVPTKYHSFNTTRDLQAQFFIEKSVHNIVITSWRQVDSGWA